MKCLLNPTTGEVRRVDLPKAIQLRADGWTYCTKTLWRTYRNRDMVSQNALEVKAERDFGGSNETIHNQPSFHQVA